MSAKFLSELKLVIREPFSVMKKHLTFRRMRSRPAMQSKARPWLPLVRQITKEEQLKPVRNYKLHGGSKHVSVSLLLTSLQHMFSNKVSTGLEMRLATTFSLDLGLADGHEEIGRECLLRHGEGDSVEDLILQHHHRVGVPHRRL